MSERLPEIPARVLFRGTLTVIAVGALFALIVLHYEVLFILLGALLVGTAIKPLVGLLTRRGMAPEVATPVVFGALLVLVLVLSWVLLPPLIDQAARVVDRLVEVYASVRKELTNSPTILIRRAAQLAPAELALDTAGEVDSTGDLPVSQTVAILPRSLLGIFATFILAFHWVIEGDRLKGAAMLLIPYPSRQPARDLVQQVERRIREYTVGQGILCLVVGLMAFLAYLIIGLPNAFALAVFAGLLEAIPLIGPTLGAVPAFIFAFLISPWHALGVVVAAGLIQQLENLFLVPQVMDRQVGVHPLVTLMAVFAFSTLFGVAGAILAIPLVAVAGLILNAIFERQRELASRVGGMRDETGVIQYRLEDLIGDVRRHVREKPAIATDAEDRVEDELEAIASDLTHWLSRHHASEQES